MATPDLSLAESLALISELGFDGVEIIRDDGYPCGLPTRPEARQVRELRTQLDDLGLRVADLVPYVRDINARDASVRRDRIDDMRRSIDLAVEIGSPSVRVWAGVDPDPGHEVEQFDLLVDGLQVLARDAEASGLALVVENHMGSHAVSSDATVAIVEAVGSPQVGILYDPANLLVLGESDYRRALRLQAPHIRHVHFKDVDVLGEGRHMPQIVGEGEVPWEWLLPALIDSGYDGFVTTEFEKRWHPDELPSSREGLAHELSALKRLAALPAAS